MPGHCSLILTTYNRQKYVGAALSSILNQTRKEFELLVWDDGSTDNTLKIVYELAGADPRVRIVASKNVGPGRALKSAAEMLRGEYIGWVDSDDVLAPTALEETAAVLDARSEVGMVYTRYMTVDPLNRVGKIGSRCLIPYSKERLLLDFMTFHFRLIRRSVYDRVGGVDPSVGRAEDYDLCLKLSEAAEIAHIPKPLYLYRIHEDAISHNSRLDQIMASKEAVARALVRRGMDRDVEVHVELVGRFSLRKKKS